MKQYSRISLPAAALRSVILVSSLALVAAAICGCRGSDVVIYDGDADKIVWGSIGTDSGIPTISSGGALGPTAHGAKHSRVSSTRRTSAFIRYRILNLRTAKRTVCMFCGSTIFPGCCDGSGSWKGIYKSLLRVLSLAAADSICGTMSLSKWTLNRRKSSMARNADMS